MAASVIVLVLGLASLSSGESLTDCETNSYCANVVLDNAEGSSGQSFEVCCKKGSGKACAKSCQACRMTGGKCMGDPAEIEEPPDANGETTRNCKSSKFCKGRVMKLNGEPVTLEGCCKGAAYEGEKLPNICIVKCSDCNKYNGKCIKGEEHKKPPGQMEESVLDCKTADFCKSQKEHNGQPITFDGCCKGIKHPVNKAVLNICTPKCEDCVKEGGKCFSACAKPTANGIVVLVVVVVVVVVDEMLKATTLRL